MAKQESDLSATKLAAAWKKDEAKLAELRAGIWAYIEFLQDVIERETYFQQYNSLTAFLKAEANWTRSYFHEMRLAAGVREKCLKLYDPKLESQGKIKPSHFRELIDVPEDQQAQVFAETLERCEKSNRRPIATDFRKTAKQIVESDDDRQQIVDTENEETPEKPPSKQVIEDKKKPPTIDELRKHTLACAEELVRAIDELAERKTSGQKSQVEKHLNSVYEGLKRW